MKSKPMIAPGDRSREDLSPTPPRGAGRFFTIVRFLGGYRPADLARDLLAGAFVAVLLIPQSMAYALLAGLPPRVGVYAAIAPAVVYALIGTSRFLSVGPVALVSILAAEELVTASGEAILLERAFVLAGLSGLVLLGMGIARLGFITTFISEPVLTGFAAAAAVLIAASQLPNFLGIDVGGASDLTSTVAQVAFHVGEVDLLTLLVAGGSLVALLLAGRYARPYLSWAGVPRVVRVPVANAAPLLVVAVGILLVTLFDLDRRGLAIVGEMGGGVPPLTFRLPTLSVIEDLLPTALAISLVAFVTTIAIGRSLEQDRRQRVEPNKELLALGVANLASSFTGGYPVGGSISRSAAAYEGGARSPLAAACAGLVVLATAVLAGPLLENLPKAILAAIIMVAVFGLVDVTTIRRTWRTSTGDGISLAITFLAVLVAGVETGIGVGVLTGILIYLWRTSRPRIVEEGRLEESEHFRSLEHRAVRTRPGSPVLVMRVDQDLYFANAEFFEKRVLERVATAEGQGCLLLDLRGVNELDTSALDAIARLVDALGEVGIDVCLAEIKQPVLRRLERSGFLDRLGSDRVFVSTHEALEELERRYGSEASESEEASRSGSTEG